MSANGRGMMLYVNVFSYILLLLYKSFSFMRTYIFYLIVRKNLIKSFILLYRWTLQLFVDNVHRYRRYRFIYFWRSDCHYRGMLSESIHETPNESRQSEQKVRLEISPFIL